MCQRRYCAWVLDESVMSAGSPNWGRGRRGGSACCPFSLLRLLWLSAWGLCLPHRGVMESRLVPRGCVGVRVPVEVHDVQLVLYGPMPPVIGVLRGRVERNRALFLSGSGGNVIVSMTCVRFLSEGGRPSVRLHPVVSLGRKWGTLRVPRMVMRGMMEHDRCTTGPQQVHDRCTTGPRQVHDKATTNRTFICITNLILIPTVGDRKPVPKFIEVPLGVNKQRVNEVQSQHL